MWTTSLCALRNEKKIANADALAIFFGGELGILNPEVRWRELLCFLLGRLNNGHFAFGENGKKFGLSAYPNFSSK